jgi:BRCA1-associated protein
MCSICLECLDTTNNNTPINFQSVSDGIIHVLCGHIYHIGCCERLDDDKCPLCRYHISPLNVSTCSLCTCENDLWVCMICGNINCGTDGDASNHRKEHYSSTGHIYAKSLASNITFDFSRNCNLNVWFQNTILNRSDVYEEVVKDPKEKVEFIISEYNSIISCQLESQRNYYINQIRKIEDHQKLENRNMNEELKHLIEELEKLEVEDNEWGMKKETMFKQLKIKDKESKELEIILKDTENEYAEMLLQREKIDFIKTESKDEIIKKLKDLDANITDLENQMKETKIHINTLKAVSKNNAQGGSFAVVDINKPKKKK